MLYYNILRKRIKYENMDMHALSDKVKMRRRKINSIKMVKSILCTSIEYEGE